MTTRPVGLPRLVRAAMTMACVAFVLATLGGVVLGMTQTSNPLAATAAATAAEVDSHPALTDGGPVAVEAADDEHTADHHHNGEVDEPLASQAQLARDPQTPAPPDLGDVGAAHPRFDPRHRPD